MPRAIQRNKGRRKQSWEGVAIRVGQGSMAVLLSVAQLAVYEDHQEDGCEA